MFYVYILVFVGGKWKKNRKKLTNVSLYVCSMYVVCMSAGNSEMLVFLSVFSQQCAFFKFFNGRVGKKQKNVSFYGVCMYVRPKLTFVSFFSVSFCTFPLLEVVGVYDG